VERAALAQQARTWIDSTGQHAVVAELIDFQDEEVRLQKEDGKVITLPVARLSEADRRYLARFDQRQSDAAGQPPVAGNGVIPRANGIDATPPETGRCCFQIFGLYHKETGLVNKHLLQYGPKFKEFVYTQYGLCDECWEVIKAEDGFREVRRHLSGAWGTAYSSHPARYDARKVPRNFPTYAQFPLDTDLAPIARAVVTAETPHRMPRAFCVLLSAPLNADRAKPARTALARMPGVDPRRFGVDIKGGRIRVGISGRQPIRMIDLLAALEKAGIEVDTHIRR
jgi:hypothetical protein